MFEDVVQEELYRAFAPTKVSQNGYHINKIEKVLVPAVSAALEAKQSFRRVYVDIFTEYPNLDAASCTVRIFDRVGLPVPKSYRPVTDQS